MNQIAETEKGKQSPVNYWRLWLFDAVLVSAGMLFFLAMQYGTYEFLGVACFMALLPFIPAIVLVGGGGSTVFALTKVLVIEKRSLKRPAALALLVAPALAVTLLFILLGAAKSPAHQLGYICLGNAPASARAVHVAGYSAFLRGEWLAIFNAEQKDFQTMVARSELQPMDEFEFRQMLGLSDIKRSRVFQSLPPLTNAIYYKRVFKDGEKLERGSVYAGFDAVTSTAVVIRTYHD